MNEPAILGDPTENLKLLAHKGGDCVLMNFVRTGYLYKTTFKYDEYRFRLNFQLGRLVVRMKSSDIARSIFRTSRTDAR